MSPVRISGKPHYGAKTCLEALRYTARHIRKTDPKIITHWSYNPENNSCELWLRLTSSVSEKAMIILWEAFSQTIFYGYDEMSREEDMATRYERRVNDRFGITRGR